MPPRPRKEDVLTEFRRAELIRAARRVFGTHGFAHATMEAVAKEAEVAKGTIYLYYRSKQEIYDATFRLSMDELERSSEARVRTAGTVQAAISAFVAARLEFFQTRPDFFRMYVDEMGSQVASPRRRSACGTLIERQTRVLESVMREAIDRGAVRPVDPAAAALAVFDVTRGLVARHLLSHARTDSAQDVAFLTDLIWTGLRPARRKHTP